MLSEQKNLLRAAEILSIFGSISALALALNAHLDPNPDLPVFLITCAGMTLLLLTFLPACMLTGEYVRTVRKPSTWRQQTAGLDASEISAIVEWAPRPYIYAACIGVAIAIGTAIKFGSITFSENQAVTPAEVTGIALYFCMFLLLALPVLGSAARMPGGYAQSDA